jgi:hypothetical protein
VSSLTHGICTLTAKHRQLAQSSSYACFIVVIYVSIKRIIALKEVVAGIAMSRQQWFGFGWGE